MADESETKCWPKRGSRENRGRFWVLEPKIVWVLRVMPEERTHVGAVKNWSSVVRGTFCTGGSFGVIFTRDFESFVFTLFDDHNFSSWR